MKIKLPQLEDDVLEVELADGKLIVLKLKNISAAQASQNGESIRKLDRDRLAGKLSYLDYHFKVLDMAVTSLDKATKDRIAKLPDEYLAAIMQKLSDLRFERIERLKKNISASLS